MKRTLAMLLAVLMLVGMLPMAVLAVDSTPTITLTTDVPDTLTVGSTFSVTATLSDNPGFASLTLSLTWNDKAVQFTGFQEKDDEGETVLDSVLAAYSPVYNQEKGIVTVAQEKNKAKYGKLFTANFKVIGSGNFDIALKKNFPDFTYADADGTDLAAAFDETAVSALCIAVPAQTVTLYKNSLSMAPGATYNLVPKVTPSDSTDKPVCTSSDEAVATVDANGVVTAVNAGTATITVTAGSVSATCEVTVSEKFVVEAQADGDNYTKLTGTLSGITEINGTTAEDVFMVNLTADMKNVKVNVNIDGWGDVNNHAGKGIRFNTPLPMTFSTTEIFTNYAATPAEIEAALGVQVGKLGTLSDSKLYALLDFAPRQGVSGSHYPVIFAVEKTAPPNFLSRRAFLSNPARPVPLLPR